MYAPSSADTHWEVWLHTVWNYVLAQPCTLKAGHPSGMLFIHRTLCTPLVAHDSILCSPLKHEGMKKWNTYGVFFFFFDTTDIWKRFASFLWKLGWGLFKPTSEDTHLERHFYILLFLGSMWLFPSHLLATIWILILCACSFIHSFQQHDFDACGKANHVPGAGLQDRYMSPYSETRLYPGIKYIYIFFFANLCEAIYSHKPLLHPWQNLISTILTVSDFGTRIPGFKSQLSPLFAVIRQLT